MPPLAQLRMGANGCSGKFLGIARVWFPRGLIGLVQWSARYGISAFQPAGQIDVCAAFGAERLKCSINGPLFTNFTNTLRH